MDINPPSRPPSSPFPHANMSKRAHQDADDDDNEDQTPNVKPEPEYETTNLACTDWERVPSAPAPSATPSPSKKQKQKQTPRKPMLPRAKSTGSPQAPSRALPATYTSREIGFLFDRVTAAVPAPVFSAIAEEMNATFGRERKAFNVKSHWDKIARARLVGQYAGGEDDA
ncbi:hypothetical protein EDC01DRAFT_207627 [Geopyxis carbonaria]|nr:hypothetical protein EDC01DRAFT_207627 [Geopyxis carbonaria]